MIGAAEHPLVGVGVGAPGLIDTATGTVRWAVGLDWRDVELGLMVTAVSGLPTVVVNDSQAAAMAEWMFGPTTRETMAGPNGRDVTVVNVKKCRYLEATGCAGVCVNMCKLPAQDVMREEFGVGLYVAPNFETCSCKMYFGQEPLPEILSPE